MKSVSTHEAKTTLSKLLALVERGDEIAICRRGVPVARLVPIGRSKKSRARPRVGEVTSAPVQIEPGALEPLGDEDLVDWGL